MPSTFTEPMRTGEYIVSESNGSRSREVAVLIAGQNLKAGTVLGKITTGGKLTQHAPAASDGSQNAVAILYANVDATAADRSVTITARDTEVNGLCLTWASGINGTQQNAGIAALLVLGIIVRT